MNQVKIGKFIAELRKSKNMTQQELGDKLNVSFKTISKWENGRGLPELSTLKPLSEELGISINELLSGEKVEQKDYINKLEENMLNTLDYSNKKLNIQSLFKTILIFILLFITILFIAIGIDVYRMKNNQPVIFSTWGFLYSPPVKSDPNLYEPPIEFEQNAIENANKITDGYIAVFHGGYGEQTYETYIYENANSGFDYINITYTTVSWGSSQWDRKITKQGTVQKAEDIFTIAKENNAYSYVTVASSDEIYAIETYMQKFLDK